MEDSEVIEGFITGGARQGFGPNVHIEGDCLFIEGWWQAVFRIAPQCFAVRNEEPPSHPDILQVVSERLQELGLSVVDSNPDRLYAITYTEIALGLVPWQVWSTEKAAADQALAERAGKDAFLADYTTEVSPTEADYNTAELGGARRVAGLPPSVVLAIGVDDDATKALQAHLTDCRFESRAFGTIQPEMCGSLIPTLVVIDATEPVGQEFVMELRAAACGRFLPVAALTPAAQVPLGADIALNPADPASWVEPLRRLLP